MIQVQNDTSTGIVIYLKEIDSFQNANVVYKIML